MVENFFAYNVDEEEPYDVDEEEAYFENVSKASPMFRDLSDYVQYRGKLNMFTGNFIDIPWNSVVDCANNLFLQVADAINFNGLTRLQKYGVITAVFSIVFKNFTGDAETFMPLNQYINYLDEQGIELRTEQEEDDFKRFFLRIEIEILQAVDWVPCRTFRQRGLF